MDANKYSAVELRQLAARGGCIAVSVDLSNRTESGDELVIDMAYLVELEPGAHALWVVETGRGLAAQVCVMPSSMSAQELGQWLHCRCDLQV